MSDTNNDLKKIFENIENISKSQEILQKRIESLEKEIKSMKQELYLDDYDDELSTSCPCNCDSCNYSCNEEKD